ncbi:MAG TPA: DNA polymerase III subunit delta [Segeticoccus sp.]|uniref:DNA polymerase III subunit delta n=1 Tax=Segeticoccus sp. TaxID=2706531 RepID=UPI002D7EEFCB|nr:DNA polymerase III subunit delta [Segeticoccus sp.]HET8602173.1 DNA polymerase III subunit delta [Segeticoccus sp.]
MSAPGLPDAVLVAGPEDLLADRALEQVVENATAADPGTEVIRLSAETYEGGELAMHASPSLFGGAKVIVVRGLHEAPDVLQTDLLAYLAAPADDVTLVVVHGGGNRGKKVLDTLKKARARVIDCPAVKSDRDKSQFIANEFRSKGRKVSPDGVRALLEAVGKDLRELAQACAQLVEDTTGVVDEQVVARYHGGRVEATGFKVADAALAGNAGEALRLLRHAIAAGDNPVPIVAVLALQLRQLVKVGAAGRGSSQQLAKELGMAPWQVDQARRKLNGWSADALGRSIQAVAAADFDVKGGGRDPIYAVERAILTIARERRDGSAA